MTVPRAATEMLKEVVGLAVLGINGVSLDIFLLAETDHPEEKTQILVVFIELGGMSCQILINVFRK